MSRQTLKANAMRGGDRGTRAIDESRPALSGTVAAIGQGLALARGLTTKHAIKQVDRLMSNAGPDVDAGCRDGSAPRQTSWLPWTGPISTMTAN